MPDRPNTRTQPLSRDEIVQFAKTPRAVKFFENLAVDVGTTLPDAIASAPEDEAAVLVGQTFARRDPQPSPVLTMLESSERVIAQSTFQPRTTPLTAVPIDGDASRILATQIFGG